MYFQTNLPAIGMRLLRYKTLEKASVEESDVSRLGARIEELEKQFEELNARIAELRRMLVENHTLGEDARREDAAPSRH